MRIEVVIFPETSSFFAFKTQTAAIKPPTLTNATHYNIHARKSTVNFPIILTNAIKSCSKFRNLKRKVLFSVRDDVPPSKNSPPKWISHFQSSFKAIRRNAKLVLRRTNLPAKLIWFARSLLWNFAGTAFARSLSGELRVVADYTDFRRRIDFIL